MLPSHFVFQQRQTPRREEDHLPSDTYLITVDPIVDFAEPYLVKQCVGRQQLMYGYMDIRLKRRPPPALFDIAIFMLLACGSIK